MNKVRWGILSTAKIGVKKVIPAMQYGKYCEVTGIGSRNLNRARSVAHKLGIPKTYGSYEELLEDPDIDAVYIPLPNHLHVPWSTKALQAGKHVLCEKPIGLSAEEGRKLQAEASRYPELKLMEAFMYRFHPQWLKTKELIGEGIIGELKTIQSFFSYFNDDPENIRNMAGIGGGGLMDIGCYCISLSRYLFEDEPDHVSGAMEYDPELKVDRLVSGALGFEKGTSVFTCSTQLFPGQRVSIYGTEGSIEIEIPFNAPPDKSTRLWLVTDAGRKEFNFDPANQYTIQADLFSRAILDNTDVPTPLEDAIANMEVIDALKENALESCS